MDLQSQEPLNEVLENYDIKIKLIKIETYKDKKAVWWVETDKGLMVLKKISNSESTLKYIISTIRHLAQNGISLAAIVKTKDGSDYTKINNTCFVLTEAVKGRSPTFDSDKELEMIVKELARFHRASKGFSVLPDTKPKIHLGTWIDDYTKQLEDMNTFYTRELSSGNTNAIGKFIIQEFPYFYKRALEAIELLKGDEYKAWVDKTAAEGSLCHQDFTAGNLIMNNSGKIYVLDTDGITVDIAARDLRKILHKIMKRAGKWDTTLAKKIMSYYQAVNPLSPAEWKVVKFDIMYPHLFIGAMNKYYYRRDKEWNDDKYFSRIKEMCAFEKTVHPVLDNFDTLIPG